MEEATRSKLHELSERIADATHMVSSLVEAENPSVDELLQSSRVVEGIAGDYAALFQSVPEADRVPTERLYGRRVTDLRRLSARLPQRVSGSTAKRASDSGLPFLLQRTPGKSIVPDRYQLRPRGITVGAEIEAWCGPCGGLTEHTIVAVVDGKAKQVACTMCKGRHGYRLTPARAPQGSTPQSSAASRKGNKPTREQAEAQRRQDARFAFERELAEAPNARPFSTKERYRKGEYLEHPEHGRGKIEEVLKGSLLVRFKIGLRPVNLF